MSPLQKDTCTILEAFLLPFSRLPPNLIPCEVLLAENTINWVLYFNPRQQHWQVQVQNDGRGGRGGRRGRDPQVDRHQDREAGLHLAHQVPNPPPTWSDNLFFFSPPPTWPDNLCHAMLCRLCRLWMQSGIEELQECWLLKCNAHDLTFLKCQFCHKSYLFNGYTETFPIVFMIHGIQIYWLWYWDF